MTAEKITCPDCNGNGYKDGVFRFRGGADCPTCKAFGKIDAPEPTYTQSERDAYAIEAIKADRERVAENANLLIYDQYEHLNPVISEAKKFRTGGMHNTTTVTISRESILNLPIELPKTK